MEKYLFQNNVRIWREMFMTAELPQDLDSNRPYVGGMGA